MANTKIIIPDFNFAAVYYPQLLEALIQFKRNNVPELTDESEFEPFIQLLRAFALVGHLNNTLVDLVANESTLPTARLVESVRDILRLIDYDLSPATPAQVEVVFELAQIPQASIEIIAAGSQIATPRTDTQAAIYFETNETLVATPGNVFGSVLVDESGTFTDITAGVNLLAPFVPWATPAVGDALYFGHATLMWDKLSLIVGTPATGITGVWEYYDGDWTKFPPDSVTVLGGGTLRVVLNDLLGASARPGSVVRVTLNTTGTFEQGVTQWNGSENFVEVGILGQTTPSVITTDYSVGSDWSELSDISDASSGLTASGDLEYTLPQNVEENWAPGIVNAETMYWIRFRVVAVTAPTSPSITRARIDLGKQYAIRLATQGVTGADDPLGSSNGLPDQEFETSNDNFINGSAVVTVDGEEWTQVSNFLSSASGDKHYTIKLGENDRATVAFGSGAAGKVPPVGVNNIGATYRFGAQNDGNVGSNTVVVDKTGLTFINKLYNPRQAGGWQEAEGSSDASLARAKIAGPSSLHTLERALGPDDVVKLLRSYKDDLGASPFSRALAIEEGAGPKTVELTAVLKGGGIATADQLTALALFYNGDKFSNPPKPNRMVANQEVVPFNYTPRTINITATVFSTAAATAIAERLRQVFQPEALDTDGVTYIWDFGGEIPLSRINHEIFKVDTSTTKVVLSVPATDITLGPRELPRAGLINITVIEP